MGAGAMQGKTLRDDTVQLPRAQGGRGEHCTPWQYLTQSQLTAVWSQCSQPDWMTLQHLPQVLNP